MLHNIRLKNFKAWGDQLWEPGIDLQAITLLLGPNSAGKTSILQLPLLLKQTFDSPDRNLDLNQGGQATDLIDLGSYDSLVHTHDARKELGLGLGLVWLDEDETPHTLHYTATFTAPQETPVVQRVELESDGRKFSVTRQAKGGYLLSAPGQEVVQDAGYGKRSFRPERALAFSPEAIAELGPLGPEVQDIALQLRREVEGITYLGPLREKPNRSYLWAGGEPSAIGSRGEAAVHALLASLNSRKRQKEGQEGGKNWLVDRVSYWLKRLGVADSLLLERQGTSRHYELMVVRGKQKANIVDVGFGVSQVLPILVLAYLVPRGSTVIAEQPEIHLHPRAQVALAELIVEVAKTRNVQFLVETHSEHLFRRLQTLVAEEEISRDACRLYFVDQDTEGTPELRKLEMDVYGKIANWPKHFFGDAIGETEKQTRKMLERVRAERSEQAK